MLIYFIYTYTWTHQRNCTWWGREDLTPYISSCSFLESCLLFCRTPGNKNLYQIIIQLPSYEVIIVSQLTYFSIAKKKKEKKEKKEVSNLFQIYSLPIIHLSSPQNTNDWFLQWSRRQWYLNVTFLELQFFAVASFSHLSFVSGQDGTFLTSIILASSWFSPT